LEIELALELELPVIVANLDGKNGMDADLCPAILRDACAINIPYNKDAIKYALAMWLTGFSRPKRGRPGIGLAVLRSQMGLSHAYQPPHHHRQRGRP
jgi:hypothetical protein